VKVALKVTWQNASEHVCSPNDAEQQPMKAAARVEDNSQCMAAALSGTGVLKASVSQWPKEITEGSMSQQSKEAAAKGSSQRGQ
jgi:hypothetical protein